MPEDVVITPDIKFVRELKKAGGDTLKKCFQCATCSVVCPISPDNRPFPRKEMFMAQWGMKDELAADPDIWLCHNCNDCSKYCPRGARPGDVLGAMRQKVIREKAVPAFMGNIVTDPKKTLVALAIPFVLFLAVLGLTGHLGIPSGDRIVYSKFFPIRYIEIIFMSAIALTGISYLISLSGFWIGISKQNRSYSRGFVPAFVETVVEVLTHKRFKKCGVNADRKTGHLLVFYAFLGLLITTIWVTYYYYVPKIDSPIPLTDPMKWLANLSALALIVGILILIFNRTKDKGVNTKSSSFDWTFVVMILLLALTGILTEVIRLAGIASLAYPMYFTHLLFVFYTIVYFPYSKLAHMGYRTLAITYSKMTGRDIIL